MSALNCRRPTIQAYAGLLRQTRRSAFLGSTALAASLFGSLWAATPASAECTGAANGSQINGVRNCTGTHPSVEHEVAGGDLVLRLLLAEITTGGMELTSPEGRNITVVPFVGVSSFTSITDEGLLLESNGGNLEITPQLTGSLTLDGFTDGLAAVTNGAGTISLTLNGTVTGQTQRGVFTSADAGNTSIMTTAAVSGGTEGIRAVTGSGNVSITAEANVTGDAGIAVFSASGEVAIDGAGAITAAAGQGIFVMSQTGPVRIGGAGDIDATACATIDTALCNAIQVELSGPADVLINRSGELRAGFDGITVRQNVPGGGLIEITGTGPILAEHRGITVLANGADVVITPGGTVEGGLSLAAPSPGGIGAETTGAGTVTITTSHLVSGGTSFGIAAVVENGNADITADAVVQGSQGGIAAASTGAGSLFIDGMGNVSATGGPAILARQEALATGDIEIAGSGDSISTGGLDSLGIRAEILNAASSGAILVTRSGTITGQDGGILARSLGDGDITVRDVGPVAGNAGIGIEATGNGGDILVEPDFAVSGSFGIVAGTTGPGTATVRFDQDVTATAGDAVTASAENGLASIQQNGGIVLATGDGIVGRSSGTGGVDLELNAGQIGTSADRVRNGILGTSTGLAGNVVIDAAGGTSLFASEKGIAATIAPTSTGDILVTSAAAIDASGTGLTDAGIYAGNGGNGATGITLAGGSIVAAGDGILAISQSNNAGGGTGGDITIDAGGVPIGTVGSPIGRTGIAAQAQGTFGDILVTGSQIVATGDGIGVAITNAAATGTVRVVTGGAITSLTGNGITASTEATAAGSTVTVNVAHDIDAGAAGVRAAGVNGLVTVDQTAGAITAGGNGIEATATGNGSVLVNAELVLAGAAGVVSTATGEGDVTINTEDRIEAAAGPGILGQVENGDLVIATDVDGGGDGDVRGSTNGIFGQATGTGTITVTANDRVTGESESGIQTVAGTGPTSITTNGNVRGELDGVFATATGAGDITIVSNDRTTGVTNGGLTAQSAGGDVSITANATTTGGVGGIGAGTTGLGTVLVNANADISGGQIGIFGGAVEGAARIDVANGADVTGGDVGIGVLMTGAGAGGTVEIDVGLGSVVVGTTTGGVVVAQSNVATTVINIAGEVLSGGAAVAVGTNGAATINNLLGGFIAGFPDNVDVSNLAVFAAGGGTMTINNESSIRGRVVLTDQADTFNNTGFAIWALSGNSDFGAGADTINNTSIGHGIIAYGTTIFDMGPGADTVNNSGRFRVADVDFVTPGNATFLNLETFNNNNGIIEMRSNTPIIGAEGTPDNFLAISGNYNATGEARLGVDAQLGGPGSTADMLFIGGNASGTTSIVVNDVDEGRGAFNPDGIVIVTVGGTTNNNFVLDPASEHYDPNRDVLDKGLFFYDLVQDGNVYKLVGLPDADAFDVPVLATGALTIWNETALGWVDRQSDIRSWYWRGQYRLGFAAGAGADLPMRQAAPMAPAPVALPAAGPGIWAKAIGSWTDRDAEATTGAFGTSFAFDTSYRQDVFSIQGGFDFGRESVFAPGDVWVFGLMGGYITSDLDFTRSPTRATYEGGTIGLSTTYLSGGFFWDTLWKVDFLDVNVRFPSFAASDSTDVVTYGSLTNVGYRFDVGSFFVEPSATFSWARADMDGLTVGDVTTSFSDVESMRGALGLRLGAGLFETAAVRVEGSLLGRVWHEFSGDAKAHFLDVGAALALTDSFEGTFGEVKAGLDIFSKGSGWGGFVNGSVKFNDDFTTTTVKGGIRYQW